MSARVPLGGCECPRVCPVHDRPRGEKLERKDDGREPIGLTGEVRPPEDEP
ncbi:hypothetical protein SEA_SERENDIPITOUS_66 [Mycobacterium phage Serendipitous]|uniref:Uncharacterized protein n=1 Tax=Mycobacterium phage Serendipitous TaxID=2301619 RepID=A0A385UL40_9CAUD|nr:hypothetical protein I5G64_gp66 [Mycobacterium phage Serendipitous]AYB70607.1 hypothetical protein SEA_SERENDIPITOUS_66 [Mycobacterium phage Serendipitous]